MIAVFTNIDEKELLQQIKSYNNIKIAVVSDYLPLISNLNLIENIELIVNYHNIGVSLHEIENDLKKFDLLNKKFYRKDSLSMLDIFYVKYLMCKYYNAEMTIFINQFHHFSKCRNEYYNFFKENSNEKSVIIERDVYKKLLSENLIFEEMDLDVWLKNSLKI
ncbi:hypothetical protein OWM07_05615 [Deferribacter thermophilus]|uniref:hypothetical protein n=1 Tax=Deferribacter thermophilus TaxID=53573 RepID=UPI003C27B282